MLADVDRALAAMLESERLAGQAPKVSFDAPRKDWAAARTSPTLNLFLADIREDLDRRSTTMIEETDATGMVISRQQPFRHFNLTYTLTAWANRAEDDHELLGFALSLLCRYDYVPPEFTSGALAVLLEEGHALHLRVGGKIFSDRFATELWSAMGTDYHPFLSVVVSLPVAAGIPMPAGPPQEVPPHISLSNDAGAKDVVRGMDPKDPERGLRTRRRTPK